MRKTIAVLAAWLCCQSISAQLVADTVFTQTEVMPFFSGCEALLVDSDARRKCSDRELVRFIARLLAYPQEAIAAETEGTVFVSFVVDERGKVTQPKVVKDIGHGCGEAALEILAAMPDWEPGQHHGAPVKVRMNLPIQFSLKKGEQDLAEKYQLTWGHLTGDTTDTQTLLDNLQNPVYVRAPQGENCYLDELKFVYLKNNRQIEATSRGDISSDVVRLVEKVKKGGSLTITASVQDRGRFVNVSRTFQVVR